MKSRLAAIHQHRSALIAKTEAQRRELSLDVLPWRTPLALVDRSVALVRRLRANPVAIVAGLILVFWLGRSRKSLWAGRMWTLWQVYSSLHGQRRRARPEHSE